MNRKITRVDTNLANGPAEKQSDMLARIVYDATCEASVELLDGCPIVPTSEMMLRFKQGSPVRLSTQQFTQGLAELQREGKVALIRGGWAIGRTVSRVGTRLVITGPTKFLPTRLYFQAVASLDSARLVRSGNGAEVFECPLDAYFPKDNSDPTWKFEDAIELLPRRDEIQPGGD